MFDFLKSNKPYFDWPCRIVISLNMIIVGFNYPDIIYYPLDTLVMNVIAFWLFIYGQKPLALLFALMALFINWQHWGLGPGQ